MVRADNNRATSVVAGSIAGIVILFYGINQLVKNGLLHGLSGYRKRKITHQVYNPEGFDCYGYDKNKYNISGIDRVGHCRRYYSDIMETLWGRLDDAFLQWKQDKYRYAVYDAKVVMEEALQILVQHSERADGTGDKASDNLKICGMKRLLGGDSDFYEKLYRTKHICNANGHDMDASNSLSRNKAYYVLAQTKELLSRTENSLDVVKNKED